MKNKTNLLIFVGVFAVIGVAVLIITKAASPSFSIEPESGQMSGGASQVSDATASGGKAISFGASTPVPSGSELFHTCYPDAFCNSSNQPVVLNGFNMNYVPENPTYASPEQLQKIKSKGFNSVRYVMHWNYFQPTSSSSYNEGAFTALKTLVDNAKNAGVYVILDPIHFTGDGTSCGNVGCIPTWATGTGAAARIKAHAGPYMRKVAEIYKDYPMVVAIDLANEVKPANYDDNAAIVSMYSTLINEVRSVDSDKILMVEPTSGNKLFKADEWAALSSKTNIVYSFHPYYGGTKNASGAKVCSSDGNNDGYSDSSGTVCGNQTYEDKEGYQFVSKADLEAHIVANLNMLADSRLRIPLHIGEWNIGAGQPNADQWRKDMTSIFKARGISRKLWNFYTRGTGTTGDPPNSNLSATEIGSSGSTPGAWKPWITDIL